MQAPGSGPSPWPDRLDQHPIVVDPLPGCLLRQVIGTLLAARCVSIDVCQMSQFVPDQTDDILVRQRECADQQRNMRLRREIGIRQVTRSATARRSTRTIKQQQMCMSHPWEVSREACSFAREDTMGLTRRHPVDGTTENL
jgi:hypothetical protein